MQMITMAYNHISSLREGNGYPLQYSCLENCMDRGAWQATVHGATKSWTSISMSQIQTAKYFCMVSMWRNRKSHSLLVMQNGAATLEDNLVVSYKIKHVLIIHSSSQALRMNKEITVHSHNVALLGNKKGVSKQWHGMRDILNHMAKQNKTIWKGDFTVWSHLYDILEEVKV